MQNNDTVVEELIRESRAHIESVQTKHGKRLGLYKKFVGFFSSSRDPTFADFLRELRKFPQLAETSYQRLWRKIREAGVQPLRKELEYYYEDPEDIFEYKAFSGFYGIEEVLHKIVQFIVSAALNSENSRQILVLYSDPGTGKTSIVSRLKELIEGEEIYVLKDCPTHDHPLWLVPRHIRALYEQKLGVKIDHYAHAVRDICAACRERLKTEYDYDFLRFPVQKLKISRRTGIGVATSYPKDPFQDSVVEFIGEIELGKSNVDPRAIEPGLFHIGNHGIVHLEEGLRREPEIFHVLFSVQQEGVVQAPGRLGEVCESLFPIITCNTELWDSFKSDSTNKPYLSRFFEIRVPFNLRLRDEIEIIKKMMKQYYICDKIHLNPLSLELIARVLIASRIGYDERLKDQEINQRIELYDHRGSGSAYECRKTSDKRQMPDGMGMGLSIRELKGSLDLIVPQQLIKKTCYGEPADNFCITPFALYALLLKYFELNDRFSKEYMKRLEGFTRYVFGAVIRNHIKERLSNEKDIQNFCLEIFEVIKNKQTFDLALVDCLGISIDQLPDFKKQLSAYTDNPLVQGFVMEKAIKRLEVEKKGNMSLQGEWCMICLRDAWNHFDIHNQE